MKLFYSVACVGCSSLISLTLTGCGGGAEPSGPSGPTTTTTTTTVDTRCGSDQVQCSRCENRACVECKSGYKVLKGTCVASCIGQPKEPTPPIPSSPMELNGQPWPDDCIDATEAHIFAIGDWGGDGWEGGGEGFGHTWANPNKCGCHWPKKCRPCDGNADSWAQKYVAEQMKERAKTSKPDYVLNVGDNFYPGGIEDQCMDTNLTKSIPQQFGDIWQRVYMEDSPLKGKPWLSVLGNHDYGGMYYMAGWDAQVFYSWKNDDWIMPAQYWSRKVNYRDFTVQYWFLEANFVDANKDKDHSICQQEGTCYDMGDANGCKANLNEAWTKSLEMIQKGIKSSTAEWHILVTHYHYIWWWWFEQSGEQIAQLDKEYGIDLMVTGHTHYQDTGDQETENIRWILTGGGGGVTSDAQNPPSADGNDPAYGFIDITINRTHLAYDMVTWSGQSWMGGETTSRIIESKKHQRQNQTSQLAEATSEVVV